MPDRRQHLRQFMAEEQLPASFENLAQTHYFPLIDWLCAKRQRFSAGPLFLGINGCQGSGKSTLADLIARLLGSEQGWNIAVLSIDDLYLSKKDRIELAEEIHPLLRTRGVPGTHDIELGQRILDKLQRQDANGSTSLPRFNKATDDRLAVSQWPQIRGAVDLVILEGWCVGSKPQHEHELMEPVNELEAKDDPEGIWRHFVNQSLYNYQVLFNRLHALVFLQAPDFNCVFQWRLLQEQKLAQRQSGSSLMTEAGVARFIQHYQRLTQVNIALLPALADIVFLLRQNHEIESSHYKQ